MEFHEKIIEDAIHNRKFSSKNFCLRFENYKNLTSKVYHQNVNEILKILINKLELEIFG